MVKDWRDWPDESTPIVAAELERIEGDIEAASAAASAATASAATFTGRVAAAEGRIATNEGGIAALEAGKSPVGHHHALGDVDGLTTVLDGKSAVGHKHPGSDITGGVVKSVNGSAPDANGNVGVPSVVAPDGDYRSLVSAGGGWAQRDVMARVSDGTRYAVPSLSTTATIGNPSATFAKSLDGWVFYLPGQADFVSQSSNTTNLGAGSSPIRIAQFPAGLRPAAELNLTNEWAPRYYATGTGTSPDHYLDMPALRAQARTRWFSSSVVDGPWVNGAAASPGQWFLTVDGWLEYRWTSWSVQAIGLRILPFVPLFKAA